MSIHGVPDRPVKVLDALPNPVLVKDAETRHVWVNQAFERLFSVRSDDLIGRLDADLFQDRQAAQCNGGDLRILASGDVDEAEETAIDPGLGPRETITRKSRGAVGDTSYRVGVMHDVTDVVETNRRLNGAGEVLKNQAVELPKLATTDPLTGCPNRRALFDVAGELADKYRGPVGLIMVRRSSVQSDLAASSLRPTGNRNAVSAVMAVHGARSHRLAAHNVASSDPDRRGGSGGDRHPCGPDRQPDLR